MKKILLIALIMSTIAGCKKDSNQPVPVTLPPVAVTYAFSSTKTDTYTIKYVDTNATVSTAIINGDNWSKSIKIAAGKTGKVTLYVESANKSFNGSGNISIAIKGQPTASTPLLSNSDTYGMRGQIIYYLESN